MKAPAPKRDRVKPIIDRILAEDEAAPRKQRHRAAQIFRRLVKEQEYEGGYDQVRRYVARRRRQQRETFILLEHAPGEGRGAISGTSGSISLKAATKCGCCW